MHTMYDFSEYVQFILYSTPRFTVYCNRIKFHPFIILQEPQLLSYHLPLLVKTELYKIGHPF